MPVSAVLVFAGLLELHRGGRFAACRLFNDALLVSIFVTRVFAFVESQFGAVFRLAIDLILLVTVRYMIEQERRVDADRTEVLPLQARLEYSSAGGRQRSLAAELEPDPVQVPV